jgi:hypothetical protein
MKRHYIISVSIVVALLVFFSAALVGCSGWFGKPEDCKDAVFDAIKNDDSEAFFACILSAPEDEEEKALLFQRTIDRFRPYMDGKVMSTNDIDEWVVLNVAPSSEHLEAFGTTMAPLPLAFKKSKGWKLDLEYTEELRELQDIYKGIYKGF